MLYAIVAVLVLIADQWLKYWVTANVVLNTGSIELIPGVIKLVNIHNDGATLGILSGARWFFVLLAVLFAAVVIVALVKRTITGSFGRWCALLALSGAIGNCIDRALFGYVVDMFRLEPAFLSWFGIFNIADIFITVCGIMFCFYLIFGGKESKKAHNHSHSHAAGRHAPADKAETEEPVQPSVPAQAEEPAPAQHTAPKHTKSHEHAEKSAPRHDAKHSAAPSPAPAQTAAANPAGDDISFSLDDIMDEFK